MFIGEPDRRKDEQRSERKRDHPALSDAMADEAQEHQPGDEDQSRDQVTRLRRRVPTDQSAVREHKECDQEPHPGTGIRRPGRRIRLPGRRGSSEARATLLPLGIVDATSTAGREQAAGAGVALVAQSGSRAGTPAPTIRSYQLSRFTLQLGQPAFFRVPLNV